MYIINPRAITKSEKDIINEEIVEVKENYEKYPTDPKQGRKSKQVNNNNKKTDITNSKQPARLTRTFFP